MPRTRRSILGLLAGGIPLLSGCLFRDPVEPARTVVTEDTSTETGGQRTPVVYPESDIEAQEIVRGPNDTVLVEAVLANEHPMPVQGTLYGEFDLRGTVERYETEFSLDASSRETVQLSAPIDYDDFSASQSVRLTVSMGVQSEESPWR